MASGLPIGNEDPEFEILNPKIVTIVNTWSRLHDETEENTAEVKKLLKSDYELLHECIKKWYPEKPIRKLEEKCGEIRAYGPTLNRELQRVASDQSLNDFDSLIIFVLGIAECDDDKDDKESGIICLNDKDEEIVNIERGTICLNDKACTIGELIAPFKCEAMAGKPKLFIIHTYDGVPVYEKSQGTVAEKPILHVDDDIFINYSLVKLPSNGNSAIQSKEEGDTTSEGGPVTIMKCLDGKVTLPMDIREVFTEVNKLIEENGGSVGVTSTMRKPVIMKVSLNHDLLRR